MSIDGRHYCNAVERAAPTEVSVVARTTRCSPRGGQCSLSLSLSLLVATLRSSRPRDSTPSYSSLLSGCAAFSTTTSSSSSSFSSFSRFTVPPLARTGLRAATKLACRARSREDPFYAGRPRCRFPSSRTTTPVEPPSTRSSNRDRTRAFTSRGETYEKSHVGNGCEWTHLSDDSSHQAQVHNCSRRDSHYVLARLLARVLIGRARPLVN